LNCSEARALLAIHQELQSDQEEVVALQDHLSQCAVCQQARVQYKRVGTQIRSLPQIEPSPDAYTKLMQALAIEHVHFIQRTHSSAVSTPTPAFLVPYVKDLGKHTAHTNNLVAFSTAETGPLHITPSPKRRSTHQMRQFAIIGVAASFLMILMISGLTSLLLLSSSHGHNIPTNPVAVNTVHDVQLANFSTKATYPSIASATVNGNTIFYTSYSDQAASWDLEQLDKNTKASTSLLTAPSTDELFILGSSAKWLVWLQISPPPVTQNAIPTPQAQASATPTPDTQPTHSGEQKSNATNPDRQWSLFVTYLGTPITQPLDEHTMMAILSTQVFHPNSVPSWVNRPVQGIWLNDSQLFVARIDDKGVSHLSSYQLEQGKPPQATEIATAIGEGLAPTQKHIFTSPTASSDNQNIYWSDEWSNAQGELQGNIWTLQAANTTSTGTMATNTPTQTPHLFLSDGMSFHPQIVADNLFFLSKNPLNNTTTTNVTPTVTTTPSPTATMQSTPTSDATATPTPTPTDPKAFLGGSVKIDPNVFTPQADDAIPGRVRAFTANGTPEALPLLDSDRIVSALQGGSRYLIWQNSGKSFEMYDVVGKYPVNMGTGNIPYDAAFLNVNDNTGVWVENSNNTPPNANSVTFNIFTWPWPKENIHK
jgi:hypothetical protein